MNKDIERIQKTTMKIICPELDYHQALVDLNIIPNDDVGPARVDCKTSANGRYYAEKYFIWFEIRKTTETVYILP